MLIFLWSGGEVRTLTVRLCAHLDQKPFETTACSISKVYKILTVEAILENPRYGIALRDAALTLIAMHDVSPRIVRYTADLKRWLLTQAILAFHFERVTAPTRPGLTAASLLAFIAENRIVSKNTAVAHLAEMRHYGLCSIPSRPRTSAFAG